MANPFVKAWKYLMALFDSKIEENADPKVQIEQAIQDAQRQHQELSQQAAAVIGNQRQLEMQLNRRSVRLRSCRVTPVRRLSWQIRLALMVMRARQLSMRMLLRHSLRSWLPLSSP